MTSAPELPPAERRASSVLLWAAWILALFAVVATLVPLRDSIQQMHVAMLLLLVVLGASATAGFAAGVTIALLAFALLSYYFQFPRNTVDLPGTQDLIELVTFLLVALVAARLLTIARRRARLAEERAREIIRLAEERQQLEAEASKARVLAEANRMKDALLAAVSHDLRTPLTTIRALAERRTVTSDDDWSLVGEEVDRLAHLVRELLDYSRIRGGALPVRLEVHAAEDLVGAVVRESATRLGGHALLVDVPMNETVLAARFDFGLSVRILANLVENAAKYASRATPISLIVRGDSHFVEFSVRNEGAGISDSDRERIFEPFVRGASAVLSRSGGVGLGLAIARSLAEMQDGTVKLEPSAMGTPTVFTLALPRAVWSEDLDETPSTLAQT